MPKFDKGFCSESKLRYQETFKVVKEHTSILDPCRLKEIFLFQISCFKKKIEWQVWTGGLGMNNEPSESAALNEYVGITKQGLSERGETVR